MNWFDTFDFWFTRIGVALGALVIVAILIGMAVAAS